MKYAVPALLATYVALVWSAASQKSESIDEGLFLAGGVAQVKLADPNIDLSHPPLLRWLAGSSAIFFGDARLAPPPPMVPREAVDLGHYKLQDVFNWTVPFFYDGNDHDRVLFWGRLPFALLGALAGWLLFVEARRRLGVWPALASLALFVLTPEVLAHGQWAHSDLASALTLLVIALALAQALEQRTLRSCLLLGGALGLAMGVKLTATLLVPFALLAVALTPPEQPSRRALTALAHTAATAAAAFACVIVAYLPRPRLLPHDFLAEDLHAFAGALAAPLGAILRWTPLPDSFLKGVIYTSLLGRHGQLGYFHGQVSPRGWWYYFPAAIFLKYPTPLLLLSAAGLAALVMGPLSRARKLAFIAPPLLLLGFAMHQSINIGVRSVLTLSPFLALWAGAAVAAARTRVRQIAAWTLVALSTLSGFAAYPDFLAYFNPLVGGNAAADRWLADSNFDWGQDLPALSAALRARGIDPVHLAYFGAGRPSHWGIHALDPNLRESGWYAISRSMLTGFYPGVDYQWLRAYPPVEEVGGSIALIRVDAPPIDEMAAGMAALYTRHDPVTAMRMFRALLGRQPSHYGAHYQLAAALEAAGERDQALAAWRVFLPLAEAIGDRENGDYARARISALK